MALSGRAASSLFDRLRQSSRPDRRRIRAFRLLWDASPPLLLALLLDLVAMATLPVAVILALGSMVDDVPSSIAGGLGSDEAGQLFRSFCVVAAIFSAAMLVAPAHQALGTMIKVKLTYAMQGRLIRVVTTPAGIGHLEDPAVLSRLGLAQGTLMSFYPADAPAALALVWSSRLTSVFAALVVGTYQVGLGVLFLVLWPATRRPIVAAITRHVNALGGEADVMRRAEYFRRLATGADAGKELRVFGLGDWVVANFRQHWEDGMRNVWALRGGIHRVILQIGLVVMVSYVGAVAYMVWLAFEGRLDLAGLVVVLPCLALTMTAGGVSFEDISLEWMLSAIPELETLEREFAAAPRSTGSPLPPAALTGGVTFHGVSFSYGRSTTPVFDHLDLEIAAGTSTAIVGANGAGKTTLVKLLTRLYEPSEGVITVGGHPLAELDLEAWRRRIGVVFQDFMRLPLSAAENIGLGAVEHLKDREGIATAAARTGIRDFIEGTPAGWSTTLSPQFKGGTDLSGGQWQRVALARALFAAQHGASILVLDEPTASMDIRGEAQFFAQFLELTRGTTTVLISHRFGTVRLAKQIYVLGEGRVIEQGGHDELMALNGEYSKMFRLQAARFEEDASPPLRTSEREIGG